MMPAVTAESWGAHTVPIIPGMTSLAAPASASRPPPVLPETPPSETGGSPAVHELTPADESAWDSYAAGCHRMPDGYDEDDTPTNAASAVGYGNTFFHTTAWMTSVRDTFGHRPRYLHAQRDGRIVGILPMFEVRSLLAGRLLVSVPYAVVGGVLADDSAVARALLDRAVEMADRDGVCCLDLRSTRPIHDDLPINDSYVGFWRRLPDRVEDVATWIPRKARAVGRHARERHDLRVEFDDRHLRAVWRLYSRSMRRLGSINYPYRFFESLISNTPCEHLVSLVLDGDQPVAGLVSFLFQDAVIPYFAGCDERVNRLGGNHLAYLSLMERAVEMGFRVFDFGRSRTANSGSFNFKKFHGFTPRPLGYQYYVPSGRRRPDLTPSNPRYRVGRKLWRRLPLWATRPMGAALSKHIPG